MNFWRSHTTQLGLTGHYSPHSLRYAWAQDAIRYYLSQGFSRSEAVALTSMDPVTAMVGAVTLSAFTPRRRTDDDKFQAVALIRSNGKNRLQEIMDLSSD